jgi:hypothetical protein
MELRSRRSRFIFDAANRRTERAAERLEQGSRRRLRDQGREQDKTMIVSSEPPLMRDEDAWNLLDAIPILR